ncbi:PQ loop repeat-domain-containing protein [Mycena albidolilacea]|uniref:PQ loop repeat-domain-containing protein n=1 Tax=Mycena albidolilacea TaxID=1033008 RepID=A0AAD6ZX86_9AGAR|nr:PQ loop repeat-domain-containing protein [Mycena albidolilacea]
MSPSLSDLLGYSSIGCWLGAQFPQVLKNIQLKSCEGLALPFLANWFLGDASNLLGCILTRQLPFQVLISLSLIARALTRPHPPSPVQTWLATYFVFVDMLLCSQYFYYEGRKSVAPPFGHPRRGSISDRHYRTLSVVAANVSAAALAAQQHHDARTSVDRPSGSRVSDDDSAFAAMADSFHSEGAAGSGRSPTRKRVSWSTERYGKRGGSVGRAPLTRSAFLPPLRLTSTEDAVDRGRSLQRDADAAEGLAAEANAQESNRRSSRASRRGASLVFLSLFALYGVGTWSGGRSANVGHVLSVVPMGYVPPPAAAVTPVEMKQEIHFARAGPEDIPPHEPHHDPIPSEPPIDERVLGRIFAWLCTTLYLTSRLPQIWKNYVRKSVEGLSMYLFIFAFLGNSFYVASILTSERAFQPPPASSEFLRESLPYLLGSGGTLMFDVTIVGQSLIYRPRPRRHGRSRTLGEEEGGLMAGDALAHEQHPPRGRARAATPSA